ncbi:50S ribosomal protein L3 [Marininema halotolerans]|uniref:Large ribosomal subunit protein uL3 n=1 Tax=Marininema halotolerans TaxID=1155944 RepID=A0A1I6T665_9BACL|nr:50S ribosomal protein L3 [Marininema halotolerans]SFS84706.1 large subunit ribosomal protein L3 [Marininema halotolerans]
MKGILGKKLGMTQVFAEDGTSIPVTVINAGPCAVLQKKEASIDGYEAIQIGFADKKEHRASKPEAGHVKKAGATAKKFVREIRGMEGDFELGQELKADLFEAGEKVDITATSKGKGFAGTIKRHNFSRGPMSHGSRFHRRPGSLGAVDPMRVFKGHKMAGRMGTDRVTIQNLEIVRVDTDKDLILVKGSVPGPKNSYVMIKSAVKGK